ncbi:uncharacterized protein [Haliotis asinina]|uniref:uncharacterized protein n=1 Tax=Haliotis asinina TaxID=109174 RepID=UPI003531D730
MAYTAAVTEKPIPEEFVDQDVVGRTVRVYLTAKVSSIRDFVSYLKKFVPDFSLSSCQAIWKTERYGQIFITMKDNESARRLLQLQCVQAEADKIYFYVYGKYIVSLRVHWLHATIKSSFLKHYFSRYGKVIEVLREFEDLDGTQIYSGVRIVKMELSDDEKNQIPHIVKFGDKQSMLITAPGRLPICLKCHNHGHVRAQCPSGVPVTTTPTVSAKGIHVRESEDSEEDSDVEDEVMEVEAQEKKRKQTKGPEVEHEETDKKKSRHVDSESLNWAEQSSQSDAVLAAMQESSSSIPRIPVQELFVKSWVAENRDVIKEKKETWATYSFHVRLEWTDKGPVGTPDKGQLDACVQSFDKKHQSMVRRSLLHLLKQKVLLNRAKLKGLKEVILDVHEGEIQSFL